MIIQLSVVWHLQIVTQNTQMGMEFKTIHDKIAQIITLSPSVNSLARKIIEVSS